MTSRRIWLGIGGAVVGTTLALALGVAPEILLVMAAVLVCPIVMYLSMHVMGRPQDGSPDNFHHDTALPEPQRMPDAAPVSAMR